MAKKSFTARFESVDPDVSFDGMACVCNVAGGSSGAKVVITDIRVYPAGAYNSDFTNPTGNSGIMSMLSVYASSGGTLVTPAKFDTAAASLPSQVEFRAKPTDVDYSSSGVVQFRRLGDVASFGILQSIPLQAQLRAPGPLDCNDHSGRFVEASDFWHADGITDTEPIVLRENEGIGVAQASLGMNRTSTWTVTVRVAGTGNVYRYRVDHGAVEIQNAGGAAGLIWTLRNNTGSGVVLQVMVVSDPDVGESNHPRFRITKTSGMAGLGGRETSVTPVAHDTANSLSEVACYAGPFRPRLQMEGITQNYWDYGSTPVTIAEQQKAGTLRQFLFGQAMLSFTGSPQMHAGMLGYGSSGEEVWPGERRFSSWSDDVVLLSPGESIAVIGGGAGSIETSVLANMEVEIQGYIQTPDAVYPIENDVLTTAPPYGPTGTEYTGDVVLPVVTDVKSGVTYGADSSLTGTYAGGGGGNTYSRGRVVNK